jgi:hypothetical protein
MRKLFAGVFALVTMAVVGAGCAAQAVDPEDETAAGDEVTGDEVVGEAEQEASSTGQVNGCCQFDSVTGRPTACGSPDTVLGKETCTSGWVKAKCDGRISTKTCKKGDW